MSDAEQICTFMVDGLLLGINVSDVHEVLQALTVTPVPLAHPVVAGLLNMRGQIVSAVDLRHVLRLTPRASDGPPPLNVVVRCTQGLISLLVDCMGDVLEVESRLFTSSPDTAPAETRSLFRGAYQLPQQLLLVFDTNRAIESIMSQAGSRLSRRAT